MPHVPSRPCRPTEIHPRKSRSHREAFQRTARTAGQTNAHAGGGKPHLERGLSPSSRWHHSARANGGKDVHRGLSASLGPGRLGEPPHPLRKRRKDTGILRASSAYRFGISRFAEMEREISFGFSIYLSESAKTGISDRQCEDHLAFDLEASRRSAF